MTVIHEVTTNGHETVTKYLSPVRCNVDVQGKNGATTLHITTEIEDTVVVETTVEDLMSNNCFLLIDKTRTQDKTYF